MNQLRQFYVDLIKKTGKVKSGFNMTIRRSNLKEVHDIVSWYRSNIDRCTHLSLIAFKNSMDLENFFSSKKILQNLMFYLKLPDQ